MKKETRNPFVGIAPFIEDDYERFFGRDSEKAVALRYIESYRITVLTGPSGCGKTSLVHSGIVHALRMRWREKRHNSLGLPLVIRSWGSGAVKEGGLDELGVQGFLAKFLSETTQLFLAHRNKSVSKRTFPLVPKLRRNGWPNIAK